jgi:hypothetical protein
MNDKQLKTLAEIALSNNALVHGMIVSLHAMHQRLIPLLPQDENHLENIHHFEQVEALSEQAAAERERLRSYFGLPPSENKTPPA